jgi:hypothetical protein
VPGEPPVDSEAPFDLMVDDLETTHAAWTARGLEPSPIERGPIPDRHGKDLFAAGRIPVQGLSKG